MLAGARCDGFVCAHRHGKIEVVVHLGLDSHHWLLDTEPPHGVRVGGWHLLLQRYHLRLLLDGRLALASSSLVPSH